jgi:hypothetical protein
MRYFTFRALATSRAGRIARRLDVGDLVTVSVDISGERYQAAELRAADPMVESPIPKLYEPVLIGFAPQAFRLRGFESVLSSRGGYAVVQEWHCEEA